MTTQSEHASQKPFWVFEENPQAHFLKGFNVVYETRMKGLPIVHAGLEVASTPFRRWCNDWVGTVLTPWSVNVIWACGNYEGWTPAKAGQPVELDLPGGTFEFLTVKDDVLGEYRMLSLMSPVDCFENQEAAVEFMNAAMTEILTMPAEEQQDFDEAAGMALHTPPAIRSQYAQGRPVPIKVVGGKVAKKDEEPKKVTRRDFFRRYSSAKGE